MKRKLNKKPKIVFVHGMYGEPHHFNEMVKYFQKIGYEVVVVRLEGHQRGANPRRRLIKHYVQQVLDAIGGDLCILVGHSMGGLIVQVAANSGNKNIVGVVTMNSAAPFGIRAMTWPIFWRMTTTPRYLWAMITGDGYYIDDDHARDLMMGHLKHGDPQKIFPNMESGWVTVQLAFSLVPVKKIEVSMLVFAATEDDMTPMRIQEGIAKKHGAKIIRLLGGHMLPLERYGMIAATEIHFWIEDMMTLQ